MSTTPLAVRRPASMDLLPLLLGVRRLQGRFRVMPAPADQARRTDQTLRRDQFTCRYCGFQARRFQRAIPRDWQGDWRPDNLVACCSFCEAALALDQTGLQSGGLLVYLPELAQQELSHIVRALYLARRDEGPLADRSTAILDALVARREAARGRLGTDDVLLLAASLQEQVADDAYAARAERLAGIRLLPLDRRLVRDAAGNEENRFGDQLAEWTGAGGPFADLPPDRWAEMLARLEGARA